jgi:SAM-dependent methyltransferase
VEIDPALNYQSINRTLWNARTPLHLKSGFYDLPGFIKNPSSLKEIELELLGNIQGKRALHLQCHFGQDTISLGKLGARTTGLDFSEAAIEQARLLATATASDAIFVRADVYDAPKVLGRTFDLVFSSYGTIGWLPDLRTWAKVIASSLKPGGRFIFAEFHPFVWTFNSDFTALEYSYFNRTPIFENKAGTYGDTTAAIRLPAVCWNHPLKDVLGALLEAGLTLKRFEEYDFSPYNCFHNTVETSPGRFMIKGIEGKLPMVYGLEAIKA